METGNTVSGQDYVIVDSRSNQGGSGSCPLVWMLRFLGNRNVNMETVALDRELVSSNVGFFVRSRLFEYAQNKLYGHPIQQNVPESGSSTRQSRPPMIIRYSS